MGNSSTSRYADGRDLYHPDATLMKWLRSLVPLARKEGSADAFVKAARRIHTHGWDRTQRAVRSAPAPAIVSTRRADGEVNRLLLDASTAPHIRKLARKHRLDEGDVATIWAGSIAVPAPPARLDLAAEADAA